MLSGVILKYITTISLAWSLSRLLNGNEGMLFGGLAVAYILFDIGSIILKYRKEI